MLLFDPRSIIRPFRHRAYLLYSIGNASSLVGTWMQRIAAGWLAWELTHSGAWLGLVAFADLFPALIIAPIAGAAADRWNRVRLIQIGQIVLAIVSLVMFGLTLAGLMTIWLLMLLTGMLGIVAAFMQPARLAFVPSLVPRADLGQALAMNSIIFNLARFVGPIVAGVLIVISGVGGVFLVNGFAFAGFCVMLTLIKLPAPTAAGAAKPAGFMRQLVDGLRYTALHTGIASMFLLFVAVGIGLRPLAELLPGFADGVFAAGAPGLSALTSATGAGAILGGIWLGGRTGRGYFKVALTSVVVSAVATMAFALTQTLWSALVIATLYGCALAIAGIAMQTAVQLAVDPAVAGRVLSLYGLIFRGTPAIGALIIGFASEKFGLQAPLFCGGAFCAVACLFIYLKRQAIAASLEPPETSNPT